MKLLSCKVILLRCIVHSLALNYLRKREGEGEQTGG